MGMASPGWDSLVRESAALARRRRRRRRQRRMLWLLTGATTAVLLIIALFVKDISRVPATARSAALSASARKLSHGNASRAAARRHHPAVTYPQVTDAASGLAFRLLSSPWRQGCPADLNTPMLDWTAGENTVAGHVSIGGSVIDWHGLACSGQAVPVDDGPADADVPGDGVLARGPVEHRRIQVGRAALPPGRG